uniref:27 kDa salivary protein n=1 Tax=Phlebotomus ariasi TaxID=59272 RepID=Q2TJF9_9DIPT|nr:27 kDa salivary protein [Phlebotomus ariasi]
MNALLLCVLLSLSGIGYSWKYPRNADQTLWAYRTCQREGKDPALVSKWMNWVLPDDPETHCYVKCVWTNLGSYDDNTGSIMINTVATQFITRGMKVPAEVNNLSGSTSGSCSDIYKKTIGFFKSQKANIQKAYYGTKEESDNWYSKHPNVKPKGTKISDFCKGREGGTEGTCKHACSMYYYRLVDEDNLVIPFRKLKIPGIPGPKIDECRRKASSKTGCKVADALYKCLKAINGKSFENALKKLDEESSRTY